MINIQDYVSLSRTEKAGLRLGGISCGTSGLSLRSNQHSAPSFTDTDVGKNIVVIGAGNNGANLYTTITTFIDSTQVELATTALNTVSKRLPGGILLSCLTFELFFRGELEGESLNKV